MNRYPYNNGHLMIAPIRHIGKIESLNDDEILQIIRLIARAIKAMDLMLKPQGYNMGINQGGIAGAGIADHLHIHLVPRWKGDTNFMLVLTETKVISEALEETYWKIKEGLGRIDDL
jgi:ATP adenylyltransferase